MTNLRLKSVRVLKRIEALTHTHTHTPPDQIICFNIPRKLIKLNDDPSPTDSSAEWSESKFYIILKHAIWAHKSE